MDVAPSGEMLFFNNTDKPGVLNRITGENRHISTCTSYAQQLNGH